LGEKIFDVAKVYIVTLATAKRVQDDGQGRPGGVDTVGQVNRSIAELVVEGCTEVSSRR
jgi:hypothetical protein